MVEDANDGAQSERDPLTHAIIGAAIAVHKALGPGLLESAYEKCLVLELEANGYAVQSQVEVPITYRGHVIPCAYRMDLVVESAVAVELKAVERLLPIHEAQLLTHMRLVKLSKGLLLNFNTPYLRDGIKRFVL